jgi:small subunit ribosomal protein S20
MPITKSAKKALRQNIKRRAQNAKTKNKFRALTKKLKGLVSEKKIDEAKKTLILAVKAIDKAVKTGVLKKNTASRKKSKLAKLVNTLLK